ncbi:MAG: hypothetical protein ACRYFK_14330 [Janthinobacterium lividum]
MAGPLAGLALNIRTQPKYKSGGIVAAIGWNTLAANKLAQTTLDENGKLVVAAGAKLIAMDFDENSASYSDDTTIGNNRFPKHQFGFKLGGRTQALNDAALTFDLVRTTWALKTRTGEFVVLGMQGGLISEQNKSGAGAGLEDFNGFDVVLSGGETAKAFIIDEAQFNALAIRVVADV